MSLKPLGDLRQETCPSAPVRHRRHHDERRHLPAKSLQAMEAATPDFHSHRPATVVRSYRPHVPVDAVVGENGAFYFAYDRAARKMRSVFAKGEDERRLDRIA